MKVLAIFFSILICSLTLSAEEPKKCLDPKDVKRIKSQFNIQVEHNEDLCDPEKSYTYKIIQALLFAEGLNLTGPQVDAPWNQDILPLKWLTYIRELSSNISGASRDPWSDCGDSLAYVRPFFADEMFLCKSLFSLDTVDILSVLVHEARHHQGYSHVYCTRGVYAGAEGGCDDDIHDRGSYAVGIESNVKVGITAKNVHPAVQKSARYAALVSEARFNEPLYKKREFIILRDQQGQSYRFDGNQISTLETELFKKKGTVVPRQFGEFVFYPDDKTQAALRINFIAASRTRSLVAQGDFMTTYNAWSVEERANLKDVVHEDISARLHGQTLEISYAENPQDKTSFTQFIDWKEGLALRTFSVADLNASAKNRIYILNDRNDMFRIEILKNQQHKISLIPNPIPGFVRLSRIGNKRFLLNAEGQVFLKTENGFVPVKNLKNMRFTDMSRSVEASRDLQWLDKVSEGEDLY